MGFHLVDKVQSMLGRLVTGAAALANDHRTKHPPFSAYVLCRRHRMKVWSLVSAPENRSVLLPRFGRTLICPTSARMMSRRQAMA